MGHLMAHDEAIDDITDHVHGGRQHVAPHQSQEQFSSPHQGSRLPEVTEADDPVLVDSNHPFFPRE